MTHNESREKQDQKDLGKLWRLKGCESQIDPPGSAVDLLSDDQYKGKRKHGNPIEEPVEVQDPFIIHKGYNSHGGQSDNYSDNLSALINVSGAAHDKYAQNGKGQNQEHQRKIVIF